MNAPARQNRAPINLPTQPSSPQRAGQATQIEQSRAAAEVYARVLVAQQNPRDEQKALKRMQDACGMPELANNAFFRFSRGGGQVSGESVHLARELARCWGNIDYGVYELSRDDQYGQSEMQARAWDLETNAVSSAIFIVPHKRDKRGGAETLTEMRDIYENNANNGARRVREAIFALLPMWYKEQAKDLCIKTIEEGGGKPLQQRISGALEFFSGYRVSEKQLVAHVGKPRADWAPVDIAKLEVIAGSLRRGEIKAEDEFPPEDNSVSGDDIKARGGRRQQPQKPAETAPEPPPVESEPEEWTPTGEDPWAGEQGTLGGDQ